MNLRRRNWEEAQLERGAIGKRRNWNEAELEKGSERKVCTVTFEKLRIYQCLRLFNGLEKLKFAPGGKYYRSGTDAAQSIESNDQNRYSDQIAPYALNNGQNIHLKWTKLKTKQFTSKE